MPAASIFMTPRRGLSIGMPVFSGSRDWAVNFHLERAKPWFNTAGTAGGAWPLIHDSGRSEEHTSELQSLMRISYAVFCLKKKKHENHTSKGTSIYHCTSHT